MFLILGAVKKLVAFPSRAAILEKKKINSLSHNHYLVHATFGNILAGEAVARGWAGYLVQLSLGCPQILQILVWGS